MVTQAEEYGPPQDDLANTVPRDKGHIAYFVYLQLGIGLLFPWNAFITAVDYFEAQYPGRHTDRLFTVCYLPTNLAAIALMIHYQRRVTARLRILTGYAGFVVAMVAVPVLDAVSAGRVPLEVMLLFLVLTGVSDGIGQAALFGDCAILPGKYTQAVVAGTATSGMLVSFLRILTKAALPATPAGLRASAIIYFSVSACICAACFAAYGYLLPRLPIVVHFRSLAADHRLDHSTRSADVSVKGAMHVELAQHSVSSGVGKPRGSDDLPLVSRRADFPMNPVHQGSAAGPPAASVLVIYTVTLAIFPGFLAEDVQSAAWGNWYPILLFTAFNVADVVGKVVPAWQGAVLTSLLTVLLGASNGYLTALAMMSAPRGYQGADAEIAGNIMVFFLVLGLCTGAACGFLWLL
ncbi:hypothetical protein WJX72_005612 [[Myrmecia] bisecta]|uniref:Equilibrative nucleoside transporter n=1 Tax=[Myrmecia] bisecta TaxID=41462 RepID=A0AAW1P4A4_9CHLO